MNTDPQSVRARLLAGAAEYQKVHEQHRRAGREGHLRRRLETRLGELSTQFERLLAAAALDDGVREQWRRHLYHGSGAPEMPASAPVSAPRRHRPPRNRSRGSGPLWQR